MRAEIQTNDAGMMKYQSAFFVLNMILLSRAAYANAARVSGVSGNCHRLSAITATK
jgi:hypothetical protein